jgi:hypothetical protein
VSDEKNNIIGVLLKYKSTVDWVYLPSEIFIYKKKTKKKPRVNHEIEN